MIAIFGSCEAFVLLKHAHECFSWCDQNVKGGAAPHRGRSASGVAREEELARTESKAVLAQYDAHVEQVRSTSISIRFQFDFNLILIRLFIRNNAN